MLHGKDTDLSFPIDQGTIKITLKPLQNCFNINSLSQRSGVNVINRVMFDTVDNPKTSGDSPLKKAEQALDENVLGIPLKRRQLTHLLSQFDLAADRSQYFTDRLIDWIDEDNLPIGSHGAENTYYASAKPARLTPNTHTLTLAEMRGFLADDYAEFKALLPLLCTRPGDNKLQVNINQLNQNNASLISAILLGKNR